VFLGLGPLDVASRGVRRAVSRQRDNALLGQFCVIELSHSPVPTRSKGGVARAAVRYRNGLAGPGWRLPSGFDFISTIGGPSRCRPSRYAVNPGKRFWSS